MRSRFFAANRQHWANRSVHYCFGHAAEHEMCEPGPPMGREDQQIGLKLINSLQDRTRYLAGIHGGFVLNAA